MNILLNYELLKLLKEYSKKNLLADDDFMKRAIKIILERYGVLSKINDVVVGKNAILFTRPIYEEETKTIYVKSNISREDLVQDFFNKDDIVNIYNLEVLTYLLEICNEIYKKYKKNLGFQDYLVYLSQNFVTKDVNLLERMASIDAISQIDALAGWLPFKDSKTLEAYIEYQIIASFLKGYSMEKAVLTSPVYKYLKAYNMNLGRRACSNEELIRRINEYAIQNTPDENLYLGLPIKEEDYFDLYSKKEVLTRTLFKKVL